MRLNQLKVPWNESHQARARYLLMLKKVRGEISESRCEGLWEAVSQKPINRIAEFWEEEFEEAFWD